MSRFEWGGTYFKGDPQKCYEEIQTLGTEYTPQQILDLARDESTELHKCFEWDDTIAAEKWRLQTARQICCSIKVKIEKSETELVSYRIIQHDSQRQAYAPVILTVRNEDEYTRLLNRAKAELESFRKRYKNIVELESVIDEIDKFVK